MLLSSTSTISTENGIIRAKGTSFCFPHHAHRSRAVAEEVCNAKNDSVAYCGTTRPEQHEWWLPSSPPPLLGASPLRTGRESFPSSGSSPSNASQRETRFRYGETL